jgi:hypothetical protein
MREKKGGAARTAPRTSMAYFLVLLLELLPDDPELPLLLEPLLPEPTLPGLPAPPLMLLPALPMPLEPPRLLEPLWPVEP